jgi:hypothetical protein
MGLDKETDPKVWVTTRKAMEWDRLSLEEINDIAKLSTIMQPALL